MPDRQLLTQRQVARHLGITLQKWTRAKADLMAEHGFPGPVPCLGNRRDPVAIDHWLDAQDPNAPSPAPVTAEGEPNWHTTLAQRAEAIAAGGVD